MIDLQQYDGIGLSLLIREKQLTAKEAVLSSIDTIERVNPALNAVIVCDFERAIGQAENSELAGPFAGVPYLVKDLNMLVAGLPATNGSQAFIAEVPQQDSELVKRLRRAGLIILGKTNTPEFGLNICTSPALFGPTRNPHNPNYSAGGSSGGSACAVAAGMTPCAHATDSGGSIRIPASNCGLFGLKPSRGRVPLGNDAEEGLAGFSTGHAVTHSVRDSALLLDMTAGMFEGDIYTAPTQSQSFLQALDQPVSSLSIACWDQGYASESVHDDCKAAVRHAATLCEQLGHRVHYICPPVDGAALRHAFDALFSVNVARLAEIIRESHPDAELADLVEPITLACTLSACRFSASDYIAALQVTHNAARIMGAFFSEYDILLTPTLANPPLLLAEISMQGDDWSAYLDRLLDEIPFTPLFNATGSPAASVPLWRSALGLPIGVQIGAAYGNEVLLFRLARQFELIAPWHDKK